MVELLAADPSLGVRGAAGLAAKGMPGNLNTHTERLRKKYRALQKAGRLPVGGSAARIKRRAEELREHFASRRDDINKHRKMLVVAEREAEVLGIDPKRGDLMQHSLQSARESIVLLTQGSVDAAADTFLEQGITDPDEVAAKYSQFAEQIDQIEKQIEAVRKLRRLRALADRQA